MINKTDTLIISCVRQHTDLHKNILYYKMLNHKLNRKDKTKNTLLQTIKDFDII